MEQVTWWHLRLGDWVQSLVEDRDRVFLESDTHALSTKTQVHQLGDMASHEFPDAFLLFFFIRYSYTAGNGYSEANTM